jgi:hypothetical protein
VESTLNTSRAPPKLIDRLFLTFPAKARHVADFCHSYREMPAYDSDSLDEGEDYTETNVLLGYASKEASGDSVSHLGGRPVSSKRHLCHRYLLIWRLDMDRRQDCSFRLIIQMQGLQQPSHSPPRTRQRSTRALSRPRETAVYLELQAKGMQEERGKRTVHTRGAGCEGGGGQASRGGR